MKFNFYRVNLYYFIGALAIFKISCISYKETTSIDESIKGENLDRIVPLQFKFKKAPHLIIAAEEWPPHVYLRKNVDGNLVCEGPMGEFLQTLSKYINFTYEIISGDGYWGAPISNGSWNGMLGMLMRKEVDVGLGPFSVSKRRSEVVDFTDFVLLENMSILQSRPKPNSNLWSFVATFQPLAWAGIGLVIAVVTAVLTLFHRVNDEASHPDYWRPIWEVYSVVMSQNIRALSSKDSSRFLIGISLLIFIVISKCYSGSLTSILSVKSIPIKYNSLRDVINDKSLDFIMEGSTSLTITIEAATSGLYKDLRDALKGKVTYHTASELYGDAYNVLPKGRSVILVETTSCNKIYSDDFSKTGQCNYYKGTSPFLNAMYSLAVQKGSILKKLFDARIKQLKEYGLYEQWANLQMPNLTFCIKMPSKLTGDHPYSLDEFKIVFLILLIGSILSTLILVLELLTSK